MDTIGHLEILWRRQFRKSFRLARAAVKNRLPSNLRESGRAGEREVEETTHELTICAFTISRSYDLTHSRNPCVTMYDK